MQALKGCDYIFLAADMHRARRLFNAICHQYLVPGVQVGTSIPVDSETGKIGRIHLAVRPILPAQSGCLLCNGFVSAARLQEESTPEGLARQQKYVDDVEVPAPSVITLNAIGAANAANEFLFHMTGLFDAAAAEGYLTIFPRKRQARVTETRNDHLCLDCGSEWDSRFARGDEARLPLID